ncbi:hypothetical protein EUTSA_v10009431mg [Eutrema salsugineum]|uniref:MADS-box domain-containing protein n=1 Tax=Eutrema salsugineum TaxID=72664 RepID=V4MQB5_EUTSA|nr:agamous-like MADS-box protein AGL29 [Eutrema salsugineum]ESQ33881.1 hypothetical protein EUTSA_v10009431mg [Eutrema salsugineum]
MREKKTKGKQKIKIRKVEKNGDRMVTFSKRRNGIYTKLAELTVLCGAETGFLVYSGAGKPYTFGSPSFIAVAERFLEINRRVVINGESSSSSAIVDAHKKVKVEELCKTFNNLMEEAEAEAERGKAVAAAKALGTSTLPVESDDDAWWKSDPDDKEEATRVLASFEEFYEKLCEVAVRRRRSFGCNGASTS